MYIAETFYTLHQNLRYKNARVYSRDRLQLTAESTSQKLHMHTADMLWLTPESVLQEYTCIQQRHMLRAYTGTYVARMHVYTIEKG